MSETSLARKNLVQFCAGCGVDLGCGSDKIKPEAFGFDQPNPYTKVGNDLIQLHGDARNLAMFKDGVLDYVYSSHLLEDFTDTKNILKEWVRVVRVGGNIVLYLPDQPRYVSHCQKVGGIPNGSHKITNFSLEYMKKIVAEIDGLKVIHENDDLNTYSFELVIQKD